MKKTKRCLVMYSFYDRTGIEAYLEKQAENGWLLEKINTFGWQFRRIEPKKIHFSVVYFSKASAYDPGPSEQQMRFREFCEHTGWNLAASNAQMQIFYNEADNPTPIETDALIEVQNIHASAKKSYLPTFFMELVLGLLQMGMFFGRLSFDLVGTLSNPAHLFSCVLWMILLILSVVELSCYFKWYRKAKKAAELDGSFVATKGRSNLQLLVLVLLLLGFGLMLFAYSGIFAVVILVAAIILVVVILASVLGISSLMKRLQVEAWINALVTTLVTIVMTGVVIILMCGAVIVGILFMEIPGTTTETYEYEGYTYEIYDDALPLRIEDLMPVSYEGYSTECNTQESVFLTQLEGSQYARLDDEEQPELQYTVTTVKAPFLYDICRDALLENIVSKYSHPGYEDDTHEKYIEIDGAPWGANVAYQFSFEEVPQGIYLLCYDTCIVEIHFFYDWLPTSEQMAVVGEKLGG